MKVLFDNVTLHSRSGPNSFAKKLLRELEKKNIDVMTASQKEITPDIQLSFIASHFKVAPMIQRLDGIYFNSDQDYLSLNTPLKETFYAADAVIYQSHFNKSLTEKWFGDHDNSVIIHNGTSIDIISKIEPLENTRLNEFEKIWSCASSWRPHKRLAENVRYFLEVATDDTCLIIAGANPDVQVSHPRIFYAGDLSWEALISLYKRSEKFIHLAWLDHCPNVVVDARACGCEIVCSSEGGTKEIAGNNATIIKENDWDFSPVRLYNPPQMDFSAKIQNTLPEISLDISDVSNQYIDIFNLVLENKSTQ